MKHQDPVIFYQTEDKNICLEVTVEDETVWLTQLQMAELFDTTKQNISLHIKHIFSENELAQTATVKEYLTVQIEDKRSVKRKIIRYSLDVIISVGYRVKSLRGTQFRIWANTVLKAYLIRGYVLNEQKLRRQPENLTTLTNTIHLMGKLLETNQLSNDETTDLIRVIKSYAYALEILDRYDHRTLTLENVRPGPSFIPTYEEAMQAIAALKDSVGGAALFGNEKDASFRSSIAAIHQTFDGRDLYASIEEKAAHLLYFIVKNHSFTDGNKRIAAFMFVWYMDKNHILYNKDGSRRIADNALVALTLMIAESNPDDKDVMVSVVANLINANN